LQPQFGAAEMVPWVLSLRFDCGPLHRRPPGDMLRWRCPEIPGDRCGDAPIRI